MVLRIIVTPTISSFLEADLSKTSSDGLCVIIGLDSVSEFSTSKHSKNDKLKFYQKRDYKNKI